MASEVKEEYEHYLTNKKEYKVYDNIDDLYDDLDTEEN